MDNLLGSVKDYSTIKKYLAAINQTTDDFLFMFDLPENRIQFFGHISDTFELKSAESGGTTHEELLSVVHPADRKLLCKDLEEIKSGLRDSHDMNFRLFNKKGETVWVNSRGKLLHDENGTPHVMIGRLSEEALRHLFNPITGLWNKTKLRADLKNRLYNGKGWLMMLVVPSLADINLTHGRDFGNSLLCEMADIFEELELVEESYHTEHNKFAIIISRCGMEKIQELYEEISGRMNEKCTVFAGVVPIDDSIFIDVSQVIDSVNITMHNAVQNSSTQVEFFSSDQINQRICELTLLEELKESVQNNFEGFEIQYQPQIKSLTYELYGVEALVRYNSPKRGKVFPDEFIPILEQTGLIDPVGMWVLENSLLQCKEWRKSIPDLQVAVNFSSVQFDDSRLGDKIINALKKTELPGSALTVELTETIQLNENKHYYEIIKYIKSYGVRFSIDDFGTGYSNLGYLKQLDVNEIKIDRSFVTEIEKNTYNYRLISNVIEFAKTNSIDACCEGVETARELSILEPLQADIFQGYLFDKPLTAQEIEEKYILPACEKYKARTKALEEIQRFKEEFGAIHFDAKNILHKNNIGLWIIRIDEINNRYELYVDSVMEHILGLSEKLSAVDCYDYWYSRILKEDIKYVVNSFGVMKKGVKAVQLEYRWNHPTAGIVNVRSSGIRTQDESKKIMLEGYHRILTEVEETTNTEISKTKEKKN